MAEKLKEGFPLAILVIKVLNFTSKWERRVHSLKLAKKSGSA